MKDTTKSSCGSAKSDHDSGETGAAPIEVEYDGKSKTLKSEDLSFQYLPFAVGQVRTEDSLVTKG